MATDKTKGQDNTPAITAEDEEWMDGAKTAFPSIENLAPALPPYGKGRLVAIWAKENGVAQSKTTAGKSYGYTETVTLVLDDGPDGDLADELIGAAPQRVDMRHSTTGLHSRLKPRVTGVNAAGAKLKHKPMIGRVNTQASSNNKNLAAFSISDPTAEDMVVARKFKDTIVAINKEMAEADTKTETDEAFG